MTNYKLKGMIRDLKKAKPQWLKTSYIKSSIVNKSFNLWLYFFKKNFKYINKGKVLIITMEALGDNVVKATSFKILSDYFGKDNVYIQCRDRWSSVYKKMGLNVIDYKRDKSIIKRILFLINNCKKINSLGIDRVIIFDHAGFSGHGKDIFCNCRIGTTLLDNDDNLDIAVKIEGEDPYILDRHIKLLQVITGNNYTLEDVKPDMREVLKKKKYSNVIAIGLGASHEKKTLPIRKMIEILNLLLKKYPEKEICLLGAGKKQKIYAEEIEKQLNNKKVKNYIDKFELLETIQMIGDSDFFIGYDSGLSNIAFSLRKKYICLFWTKSKTWQHPFKDVKIILGDEKNIVSDGYYGTEILNSIKTEQIEKALKELEL